MGKTKEQREAIMEYNIYLIYCKNEDVKDIYIGSTENLVKRMICHKSDCNNENSDKYNQKIYKIIRDNGNWENWEYTVLEVLECNAIEAEKREEYYRKDLEADMNSLRAFITQEELRERKKEWYENNKFKQQRINTINRLKKGMPVRDSTLEKFNIDKQDYINE